MSNEGLDGSGNDRLGGARDDRLEGARDDRLEGAGGGRLEGGGGSGGLAARVRLERLRVDHADAVLAFELENRGFFAERILDRGDEYFAEFAERHQALMDDQAKGVLYFHVLVEEDGSVIGRFNLVDVADGSAELGYRLAERATGRGLATAAVMELCELAVREYGITELRAGTSPQNKASQGVLERSGFVVTGEGTFNGRPDLIYTRRLSG